MEVVGQGFVMFGWWSGGDEVVAMPTVSHHCAGQ